MKELYKRCLAHGVKILPYQMKHIDYTHKNYRVPVNELRTKDKEWLEKYVEALHLCGFEAAYYWSRGHEILEELGFEKTERSVGHRTFVGYKYITTKVKQS